MTLNDAALNIGANAIRAAITHVSLHSAAPNATGSNETTAARRPIAWSAAVAGDITASNIAFTGVAANGPVTHLGYWSAATGGTFYGFRALAGDQSANAAGEYTVTSVSETS